MNYNVSISCATNNCANYGIQRFNNIENTRRTTHFFESNASLNQKNEKNVKELIENYWLRKEHKCQFCEENMEVVRTFSEVNPILIAVSISRMDTLVDPILSFRGSNYSVFAVAYTDNNHFLARIKLSDGVYEYDGMKVSGRLQKLTVGNPLQGKIKTLYKKMYKSQMIWYKKND